MTEQMTETLLSINAALEELKHIETTGDELTDNHIMVAEQSLRAARHRLQKTEYNAKKNHAA